MKAPALLHSLLQAVSWHRRALAALFAAVAVFATIVALRPPELDAVSVLVAARPLPGGTVLTDSDVAFARLPPDRVPDEALTELPAITGRTLAGPVTRGSVLTSATVASGQELARPGHVVLALPIEQPALAARLQPGSVLDIFGSSSQGVARVASGVRVVSAPAAPGGSLVGDDSRVVLVEISSAEAATLTEAMQSGAVTIALR